MCSKSAPRIPGFVWKILLFIWRAQWYNIKMRNPKESAPLDKFFVNGGKPLCGEVTISGAKNAAVAIIPAAILAEGPCIIENVPNISDVALLTRILHDMGASVRMINKSTMEINAKHLTSQPVPYDLARNMRASYYFWVRCWGGFPRPACQCRAAAILA